MRTRLGLGFALLGITVFALACTAATTAIISGVAPIYNSQSGSCDGSTDTLRDLKEIVIEGKVASGSVFSILKRTTVTRGAPFAIVVPGLPETFYTFRVAAADSSGNFSCYDTLATMNLLRVPGRPSVTGVSVP